MKDAAFVAPSITMMPVLPWMMAYTVLVTMFTAIALTPSLTPASTGIRGPVDQRDVARVLVADVDPVCRRVDDDGIGTVREPPMGVMGRCPAAMRRTWPVDHGRLAAQDVSADVDHVRPGFTAIGPTSNPSAIVATASVAPSISRTLPLMPLFASAT